jgi:hypothetical protein
MHLSDGRAGASCWFLLNCWAHVHLLLSLLLLLLLLRLLLAVTG